MKTLKDYRVINQWIRNGEGARIDFKTSITSLPKIAKSLVAFSNSRGGKIVVGVEDKGAVLGVDVEGEKYQLEKAGTEYCRPTVEMEFETLAYQEKQILVAQIRESRSKPHLAIDKKGTEKIYIRQLDQCVVPDKIIQDLLLAGEMNDLQRTSNYHESKKRLIAYLQKNNSVSLQTYMDEKGLSEKNAKRALLDFMMDGFVTFEKKDPWVIRLV